MSFSRSISPFVHARIPLPRASVPRPVAPGPLPTSLCPATATVRCIVASSILNPIVASAPCSSFQRSASKLERPPLVVRLHNLVRHRSARCAHWRTTGSGSQLIRQVTPAHSAMSLRIRSPRVSHTLILSRTATSPPLRYRLADGPAGRGSLFIGQRERPKPALYGAAGGRGHDSPTSPRPMRWARCRRYKGSDLPIIGVNGQALSRLVALRDGLRAQGEAIQEPSAREQGCCHHASHP